MIEGLGPLALATPTLAQTDAGGSYGVWWLFRQSFDPFTVVLLLGSVAAVTIIVRNLFDLRERVIAPPAVARKLDEMLNGGRISDMRSLCERDRTLVSSVVGAALGQSARGRAAMREAAEVEAGLQCARWFRRIEILNVIGNLGPLVGLAGTVWGMIIAFTSLGASGGEAGPTDLSLGISKALFHTLLGLVLAIPCLLVYGLYRGIIDRICNRAMADAARIVERLPEGPGL
jgi:biopolymer transport protein ExbB